MLFPPRDGRTDGRRRESGGGPIGRAGGQARTRTLSIASEVAERGGETLTFLDRADPRQSLNGTEASSTIMLHRLKNKDSCEPNQVLFDRQQPAESVRDSGRLPFAPPV